MIVYLDRDALVRLYVKERGRDTVRRAVAEATAVATTAIGYPWVREWLGKAVRDGMVSRAGASVILTRLDLDWHHLVRVPAADPVLRLAGDLADRWSLDGRSGMELASALVLRQYGEGCQVGFAAFERRLARAAAEEGLEVLTARLLKGAS